METATTSSAPFPDTATPAQKRKRSPSIELTSQAHPPTKAPKTSSSSHLQINYLARQYTDTLPLITADDPLPFLLNRIADYDGVLHRHESMAGNLGARPLGPILIQRFERLFDGPPRVLKNHGKEGTSIGWLDVVEFARNKPEQFNLEKSRDGIRVCQFYTKQCRVEISEEDFLLISSGIPQKMIPPQPIVEDEEKELGTLEILERNLAGVVQAADQVSAKARQLNHRLKNRKAAIISRREAERLETTSKRDRGQSPAVRRPNGDQRASASPTQGFVAVNSKSQQPNGSAPRNEPSGEIHRSTASPSINGISSQGASAATRNELLSKFHTNTERVTSIPNTERRGSGSNGRMSLSAKPKTRPSTEDYAGFLNAAVSPVPIPNTPTSLLPHIKPSAAERYDDSGPYKADMMLRMEQLNRSDRVQPPCDRCRRLHMDCLKNLTACMGCTRKHAKCSWKDVEEQELIDHPFVPRVVLEGTGDKDTGSEEDGQATVKEANKQKRRDWDRENEHGVRDEELLGEESDDEETGGEGILNRAEEERQHHTKSHSPVSGPAPAAESSENRDGARSAPAMSMHAMPPISPQVQAQEGLDASSAASLSNIINNHGHPKPEIPLYRVPTEPPTAPRTFTAHEWDHHTRSPTTTRATPSSDVHDELKSAALEAERKFSRDSDLSRGSAPDEQRRDASRAVRVYTAGSEPIQTSSVSRSSETREVYPIEKRNSETSERRESYAGEKRESFASEQRDQYASDKRDQYASENRDQYASEKRDTCVDVITVAKSEREPSTGPGQPTPPPERSRELTNGLPDAWTDSTRGTPQDIDKSEQQMPSPHDQTIDSLPPRADVVEGMS